MDKREQAGKKCCTGHTGGNSIWLETKLLFVIAATKGALVIAIFDNPAGRSTPAFALRVFYAAKTDKLGVTLEGQQVLFALFASCIAHGAGEGRCRCAGITQIDVSLRGCISPIASCIVSAA